MLQELEQTVDSARLRKCLEETAHLSRGDLPAEQFFRKFMSALVPALRARGMAMWFQTGQEFQCAGAINMEETEYQTDPRQRAAITAALREAADNRRPVIVPPGGEVAREGAGQQNFKPYAFFYAPLLSGEGTSEVTLHALMQVWLPTGFDARRYNDVIAFMQAMAREGAVFLRAKRIETLAAGNVRQAKLLQFVSEIGGQYDLKRLGTVLVNWIRDITGVDRCCFFVASPTGILSPVAVSNVEAVNPKSALVQLQLKLAREAMEKAKPTIFQKNAPKTELQGDISDYFVLSHATEALAIPLVDQDKQRLGLLLIENTRESGFDKETQNLSIALATRSIRAVAGAREVQQLPMLKLMKKLSSWRRKLTATKPKAMLFKYGIPLGILFMIASFPMRLMVRGDCLLVPKVHGVAVAEVGGRVTQVLVHEGDIVHPGQRIAKIDDADIRDSLRVSQEDEQRCQLEADRAEAAGDQAARQLALVEENRTVRQTALLQKQLDRTWITVPDGIQGVILTKDIEMLTGAEIPMGTHFCEIGDFHRWQLINKVPESEVGLLEMRLRQGPLAMEFVLNSAPGREIDASIPDEQAISPISTAVPGANVFMVKADFTETPDMLSALKSGYSGRFKIPLNRRPALYLALRKFINYMRVRWFF